MLFILNPLFIYFLNLKRNKDQILLCDACGSSVCRHWPPIRGRQRLHLLINVPVVLQRGRHESPVDPASSAPHWRRDVVAD